MYCGTSETSPIGSSYVSGDTQSWNVAGAESKHPPEGSGGPSGICPKGAVS